MLHNSNPPKTFRAEYNAVKNYIHNTLEITKDDIKQIIKEAVEEEIRKLRNDNYFEHTVGKFVSDEIHRAFNGSSFWTNKEMFKKKVAEELSRQVVDTIANQLTIDVSVNRSID